jgi:hypothetical protein
MKRRNCQIVILKMLEKVPEEKIELIKDLKWNYDDASYKAPEETLQWQRTMETLMKHIPAPTEDWEFKVLNIFTTTSIEKLREQFKNK